MNKSVIIDQPFGLGDCIFAQGVAQHYIQGGYKVYWPVKQIYLNDLRRAYPDIIWMHENLYHRNDQQIRFDILHALYAPIRWSSTFYGSDYSQVMRAKYDMYGLDWRDWRKHAQWKRDIFKEQELLEAHGINESDKFILISQEFGGGSFGQISVPLDIKSNGMKRYWIKQMDGFSLFDWSLMMSMATEIHFVSSSNIYILEMLDLKAEKIHLYPRKPREFDHRNYDYILERHNYILEP